MSFHEVRLPENISYGSKGGPGFNTSIVVLGSGSEQRNINWEKVRRRYDVAYGIRSATDLKALVAFFLARFGRAHGFRYKDWSDFVATTQPTTTLTTKTFQMLKRYSSGGYNYDLELKKIVTSTTHVFVGGVEQVSGWSVAVNTGIITFTDAPGGTVTHTCEFDVPVRFDTDELETSMDQYMRDAGNNSYVGQASVPIVEDKIA